MSIDLDERLREALRAAGATRPSDDTVERDVHRRVVRRRRRRRVLAGLAGIAAVSVLAAGVSLLGAGSETTLQTGASDEDVAVPDVVGLTAHEAIQTLTDAGFQVRFSGVTESQEWVPANMLVVGQNPRGGTAPSGSWVSLTLESIVVPDLTGLTLEPARQVILDKGLTVAVVDQETSNPGEVGKVLAQAPEGVAAVVGSTVQLTVGVAPGTASHPADNVVVPDVAGLSRDAAGQAIAEAGLVPRFVTDGSPSPNDVVVSEEPGAGGSAPRGASITLMLAVPES